MAIIIDVSSIIWETVVLSLSVIIGVATSIILAIANEKEKRYVLKNYPNWTETYRYVNRHYTYFSIVLILISAYNFLTIARYYFVGEAGELIVYLLFISVAIVDTLFFQYVLSFSVNIPMKISNILSRIVNVATAIVLFIYGVQTPVKPIIDEETRLVDYVSRGTISWYSDLYFGYIGVLLGITLLILISLLITQWKKLSKLDRLRIFTMTVGYGLATSLGTLLNYVSLNLLIEAIIYSFVITVCTLVFASGPLINFYFIRKRRASKKQAIT